MANHVRDDPEHDAGYPPYVVQLGVRPGGTIRPAPLHWCALVVGHSHRLAGRPGARRSRFFHGLGHMGIYIGNDQFVHAPHTGDVVKISSLSSYGGYVGAVRISG
jgi:NlpC/P60 family protein